MKSTFCSIFAVMTLLCGVSHANLISEFEPNPAGGDPAESTFELSGVAGASLDLWILSIENDGINGTVDRASNVTGTYYSNGLAVVNVPDLENPSFTVLLTDTFTGATGLDLDPTDSGSLDLSLGGINTVFDAVGVSDSVADDATLYASGLGGTDILYNGQFEPLSVFRDASTGDFFQTVTVDFGDPTERLGVFQADATEVAPELFGFTEDVFPVTTFGDINPTISAVPEPSSMVVLAMMGTVMLGRRRRKS